MMLIWLKKRGGDNSERGGKSHAFNTSHITSERSVDDVHGNDHELPARTTDIGFLAASSDIIIVGHVDVKHHLLPLSTEVGLLHPVLHTRL